MGYHSSYAKVQPHFDLKHIFPEQELTKWMRYEENLSKTKSELKYKIIKINFCVNKNKFPADPSK